MHRLQRLHGFGWADPVLGTRAGEGWYGVSLRRSAQRGQGLLAAFSWFWLG